MADDDSRLREILGALQPCGFDVVADADGQAVVELDTQEGPFDVFLSDEEMPTLPGREALGVLRERGVTTPAVILTGAGASFAQDAHRRRTCEVVRKPIAGHKLVALLRQACGEQ